MILSEFMERDYEVQNKRIHLQWCLSSWLVGIWWSNDAVDKQYGISVGPIMAFIEWEKK